MKLTLSRLSPTNIILATLALCPSLMAAVTPVTAEDITGKVTAAKEAFDTIAPIGLAISGLMLVAGIVFYTFRKTSKRG